MNIQRLKGFRDLLPGETLLWRQIEGVSAGVFRRYGFEEIRLPLLEDTALFRRSIGEATDIVEKEMYTFVDTGGDSITLRPEGTASTVRAYLENGLYRSDPKAKLYYQGPMFRRERPQKGRLRQFHQIGAECFGWAEPAADADLLCLVWDLFSELTLSTRVRLEVNSLGCAGDRRRYVERLQEHLRPRAEDLCDNCRRRLEVNPLRLLDCKSANCREATTDVPLLGQALCGECSEHFGEVRRLLNLQAVPHEVNPRMVRGLDYYNRTTFELLSGDLGAQNAVAAGGRYDGLLESLGGPPTPALGFALGMERLSLLLGAEVSERPGPAVYLAYRGPAARDEAMRVRRQLLRQGVWAEIDYEDRSLRAQVRGADRRKARFVLILGEEELAQGTATLKDLTAGAQEVLPRPEALRRVVDWVSSEATDG